ncbi:Austinol synthesis protein H [Paramyrothecium foliicola]|nr:Austinol synthesis protein H [Paramyrothecium foliicola]
MSPLRDQLLQTAQNYLAAFNTNTPEGVIAHRSVDCKHRIIPTTAGHPVRSNEEYQAFMAPGLQLMKNFQLKIAEGLEPIVDEEAHKIVLYLTSSAETPIGPYVNEYAFALHTNDAGTEIIEIVEFIDTAVTGDFMKRILEFIAEHGDQLKQE